MLSKTFLHQLTIKLLPYTVMFKVSSIEAKNRAAINKALCTCVVTNEKARESVLLSLLQDRDTSWITGNDVLTILREKLIGILVCTIVEFIGMSFGSESFVIRDF